MIKKTICLIIPTVSSGGIEADILRYLEFLESKENITILVRSSKREGDFLKRYQASVFSLKFMSLGYVNPLKLFKLYIYFKNSRFQTVCDLNSNFSGISMLASYLAGIKKRITFYKQGKDHFNPSLIKNGINKFYNSLVFKYSTDILSNSHSAIEYFFPYRNANDDRFDVIYNGINADKFNISKSKSSIRKSKKIPSDKFVIGHVGRLDKAKNQDVILQVCKQLYKEHKDIHFVLCGKDTESLLTKIEALGLSDFFTILGFQNDIPNVLKSFDLFLFPSITEGQPNALLEAMLSGIPIVASDIEPIKECFPKKYHQYLVNPTDSDALCKCILKLKNQNIDMDELREYARIKFSANKNLNAFKNKLSG